MQFLRHLVSDRRVRIRNCPPWVNAAGAECTPSDIVETTVADDAYVEHVELDFPRWCHDGPAGGQVDARGLGVWDAIWRASRYQPLCVPVSRRYRTQGGDYCNAEYYLSVPYRHTDSNAFYTALEVGPFETRYVLHMVHLDSALAQHRRVFLPDEEVTLREHDNIPNDTQIFPEHILLDRASFAKRYKASYAEFLNALTDLWHAGRQPIPTRELRPAEVTRLASQMCVAAPARELLQTLLQYIERRDLNITQLMQRAFPSAGLDQSQRHALSQPGMFSFLRDRLRNTAPHIAPDVTVRALYELAFVADLELDFVLRPRSADAHLVDINSAVARIQAQRAENLAET